MLVILQLLDRYRKSPDRYWKLLDRYGSSLVTEGAYPHYPRGGRAPVSTQGQKSHPNRVCSAASQACLAWPAPYAYPFEAGAKGLDVFLGPCLRTRLLIQHSIDS